MSKQPFAQDTDVPVARSMAVLKEMVKTAGGTNWTVRDSDDVTPPLTIIEFRLQRYLLRLVLIQPLLDDYLTTEGGRARPIIQAKNMQAGEERRRWRVLVRLFEAKLLATRELGVLFTQEFLSYIVMENGQTVGEQAQAFLAQAQIVPMNLLTEGTRL